MRLIKYLKGFTLPIVILVVLLGARAITELQLPTYTSDIVNVGIQQGGIEDAVPKEISSDTYNKLQLFMTEEEMNKVDDSYNKVDNNKYELKSISEETRSSLNTIFKETMLVVQGAEKENTNFEQIEQGVKAGVVTKDSLVEKRKDAVSSLGTTAETILKVTSAGYVKEEYSKLGVDVDSIRNSYLGTIGMKMILATLIAGLASIGASFISSRVSSKVAMNLRDKVYKKVLSFSKEDFDKFSTASLITRSTNDIQQIQNTLNMTLFIALYSPIMSIWGVYKVLQTDTGMTWTIAVGVAVLMLIMGLLMSIAIPKFKMMQKLIDRVNLVSRELLTGLSVIRVFGREKYEETRFDGENKRLLRTQLFVNRVMSFMMPVIMLIMNGLVLLIIWVGGKNIDTGSIQVGDMMAFITYAMQIVMSFLMLTFLASILPRATVASARVDEVLAAKVSVVDGENVQDDKLANPKGELKFEDVTFTFDGADSPVLKGISFEASPGKMTAIIGSTGSGKSTLIHLIPRYFDAQSGKISIDGVDIKDISLHKLRDMLGFVPQKGVLFSGDIESNIKFGDETISDEAMKLAAEISQAEEFINAKEDKYNSHISQGGSNVSGGQKQRLSIARAIAKNPKILLFDDSFSALDYKTDVKLRKVLQERMTDVTTIVVAQRISTIMNADKIIVLNEGEVVGIGKHRELLANCETYKQIAESQLSEEELAKGGSINA